MKTLVGMCLTARHDFLILGAEQQEEVRRTIRPLYDHHVKPLVKENAVLRKEMKRLGSNLNAELHPHWDGPESPSPRDLVTFVKAEMAALRARAEKAEAERDALLASHETPETVHNGHRPDADASSSAQAAATSGA